MTVSEFLNSKWYKALISSDFSLTRTIVDDGQEKTKAVPYKEACAEWWKNMTNENKKIVMTIPNFDKEKFAEITGISVEEEEK